jgi:hypothetical protein
MPRTDEQRDQALSDAITAAIRAVGEAKSAHLLSTRSVAHPIGDMIEAAAHALCAARKLVRDND